MKINNKLFCLSVLTLSSLSSLADVRTDPGDYAALPNGTNIAILYQQNSWADSVYSGGKKAVTDLDMRLHVETLRLIHFTDFFGTGYTWDPQIVIPYGWQKNGKTDDKYTGIGDITVGGTLWTINRPEKNEFLGWSIFITAPTGHDKNKGFALSNNRWASDFQVGYVRGLTDKITYDVIGEVEVYKKQRETHAQKRALYQIQNHLRYNFTDTTFAAISWRQNWGAKERLDGETIATSHNNSTLMLTLNTMATKQLNLQVQYVKDINIREGAKINNGIQFRLAYFY